MQAKSLVNLSLNIKIPTEIKFVINKLEENGFKAYVVGGAVRDALLNKTPYDFDVTTDAKPYEMHRIFEKCIDSGIKHGTVTVISNNTCVEVTTFRVDGTYKDHRKPENVSFSTSLSDDLKRRDFTVNAIAYDGDKLVDLFNGQHDLKNKIIRAVGNAYERFNEDALRMMRAIRFSCTLSFKIEDETKNAISNLSHLIEYVSCERIKAEFDKLIMSDCIENLNEVKNLDFFKFILPSLQNAVDNNTSFSHISIAKKDVAIRYVMLFMAIGEKNIREFLNKYKFSNAEKKEILLLFEYSQKEIKNDEKEIKHIISKISNELFKKILIIKKATGENVLDIEKTYEKIKDDPVSLKDLAITGNDLINAGFSGKDIKNALEFLLEKVIEDKTVNTKEKLMIHLRKD